jgi:hypothetical protein
MANSSHVAGSGTAGIGGVGLQQSGGGENGGLFGVSGSG